MARKKAAVTKEKEVKELATASEQKPKKRGRKPRKTTVEPQDNQKEVAQEAQDNQKEVVQEVQAAPAVKKVVRMTKERRENFLILAFLHFFPGNEGLGGKQAWCNNGRWYPGTRLRGPEMPLYRKGPRERAGILGNLVDLKCLETYIEVVEDGNGDQAGIRCYRTTPYGLELLKKVPHRMIQYTRWFTKGKAVYEGVRFAFAIPALFVKKAEEMNASANGIGIKGVHVYEYDNEEVKE